MRWFQIVAVGAAFVSPTGLWAAEQLAFAPRPAWVIPQTIPQAPAKGAAAPIAGLLIDQQIRLEPGKISTYAEIAVKIQKPEGLAAGNLSLSWDPSRESLTVHRLEILRAGEAIDVLASGQRFTTVRRESNLEYAVLNGVLTANIQPEDLREGDIVVLATTTEHSDPVFKGHVESAFAEWTTATVEKAHARLTWPSAAPVKVKHTAGLAAPRTNESGGFKAIEFTATGLEPDVVPKGAPARFKIGRLAEASDFATWADVGRLMAPLYRSATIPATGPLRDEVEKIRKASADPKVRAEKALQLAQQRVRYVALLLNQGGYVPATPQETWSRRFGDCKAKTALLLATLREYGIAADPVAVHSSMGDIIADRLPMIGLFDHVLVRARIDGRDYWLDGTRSGDSTLALIPEPEFGWGLPLTDNAELVHIVPGSLAVPETERTLTVDARDGVYGVVKFDVREVFQGDYAISLGNAIGQLSAEQRAEFMRQAAKKYLDDPDVTQSDFKLDPAGRQAVLTMAGSARLHWDENWFAVPMSDIGFAADFHRAPGRDRDAPFAVGHPSFVKDRAVFRLPPGFVDGKSVSPPVKENLAGVAYARTTTIENGSMIVDSAVRSLTPEVPFKEAQAAQARLRALADEQVYLQVPGSYQLTDGDRKLALSTTPTVADDYHRRGQAYLADRKLDEAEADFTKAFELNPKGVNALGNRLGIYLAREKWVEAERDLRALGELDPKHMALPAARGLLAFHEDDFKAAAEHFTEAMRLEPASLRWREERAQARYKLDDFDGALADSAAVLAKSAEEIDMRLLRANILLVRGTHAEVAAEADRVIADNPGSEYAFVVAGGIYNKLGRKADALKAYDRALALSPHAYVYINRARVHAKTDRAARRADLERALKLEPDQDEARAMLARLAIEEGKFADAIEGYEAIVKNSPDARWAAVALAIARWRSGDQAGATTALAELRRTATKSGDFGNLCWEQAVAGVLLDNALDDCRKAISLATSPVDHRFALGMTLLKLGRTDEAIAEFDKLIAVRPRDSTYFGRALAHRKKGDQLKSAADRAEALKLDPDVEKDFEEYGLTFD